MCGKIEREVGKEVDLGMEVINKGYFYGVRVLVIIIEYTTTSGGGLGQTVYLTATCVMCKEIEQEVESEVNVKIKGINKGDSGKVRVLWTEDRATAPKEGPRPGCISRPRV